MQPKNVTKGIFFRCSWLREGFQLSVDGDCRRQKSGGGSDVAPVGQGNLSAECGNQTQAASRPQGQP